ncbi:MAG: formylglycine-generating enzyme family protein [Magnetococcus sp. YQC-5]
MREKIILTTGLFLFLGWSNWVIAMPGDVAVPSDGKVEPVDALAAWKMSRGQLTENMDADVAPLDNPNGKIELEDALTILRHSIGKLTITKSSKNNLPTISSMTNQTTAANTATNAIAFTVSDVETVASSLTVTGSSSNKTLVPDANIVFGGSGGSRTVMVTPASGQSGSATITVTVNDGKASANTNFVVTVSAPVTTTSVATTTSSVATTTSSVKPTTSVATTTSSVLTTTTIAATSSVSGQDYTNSLGMKFKLIPAGTFTMGSPSNEVDRDSDEGPQHSVTISKAFYMGTTEITQGQWKAVMGTNPSYFSSCGDTCPVEKVSWDDLKTFITKLNAKGEGTYRLPTEAEWEYVARAGTTTAWSFGDNSSKLGDYAWYSSNSNSTTHPVATKLPNPWGIYDMHGNVWEWVQDWKTDYSSAAQTDPIYDNSDSYRVFRGGSWSDGAGGLRSAFRFFYSPDFRTSGLGARLARTF